MQASIGTIERRTTADEVFDRLHQEIVSLELLPGTKLSEAEVARRFGVSRQPVRDAFGRLESLDLLLVRPQKATEIRAFSMERIANARLIRLAVELEVVRRACAVWDAERTKKLQQNLDWQSRTLDAGKLDEFNALDYHFHKLICELGGYPLAAETIKESKQKIDRLCMLSLGNHGEANAVLAEHRKLAEALSKNAVKEAVDMARVHLSRLDNTIDEIHRSHAEYFE